MMRKEQEIRNEMLGVKREGKRIRKTKGGRKRCRKRGERPSAITAVSTRDCLDEISMIRRSPQPVSLDCSLQFF